MSDGSSRFEALHQSAKRFSLLALLVFLAGNAVGDPLCIAAGDHFVKREWLETAIGFGVGIPLVAIAWVFPFRTDVFPLAFRKSIRRQTYRWWPMAVLLAFIYVVGPEIYSRAMRPNSTLGHDTVTNEEIAKAVGIAIERETASIRIQLNAAIRGQDELQQENSRLRKALSERPAAPIPVLEAEVGIKIAQAFRSLPHPCKIEVTDQSGAGFENQIKWIAEFGDFVARSQCNIEPNNHIDNADQPRLKPTKEAGIVVHWKGNAGGDSLASLFDMAGLRVRVSHELNLDAPENLIWIDIGPGSPWKQ